MPYYWGRTGGGGVTDHGLLDAASLLDDDHPQYLLIDGTRAMTGSLEVIYGTLADPGIRDVATGVGIRLGGGGLEMEVIRGSQIQGAIGLGQYRCYRNGTLYFALQSTSQDGSITGQAVMRSFEILVSGVGGVALKGTTGTHVGDYNGPSRMTVWGEGSGSGVGTLNLGEGRVDLVDHQGNSPVQWAASVSKPTGLLDIWRNADGGGAGTESGPLMRLRRSVSNYTTSTGTYLDVENQGTLAQQLDQNAQWRRHGLIEETLTIAAGVIVTTGGHLVVDTELSAATDDLDTITAGTGVQSRDRITLQAADDARTVVVRHNGGGTGNIRLDGSTNFSMDNSLDRIELQYDGTNWCEISRSNNGA